ncbi:MAG: hypothetical protein U1F27_17550 [Turneriella sp.]
MKQKWVILFLALTILNCKKSYIFTEIDAGFKSLDDVFVAEFKGQPKFVGKNEDLPLNAQAAMTGRYGTALSLDVWEFGSENESRAAYETLVAGEKANSPREYDQTKSGEYRYMCLRASGVTGEIFTVKKLLFRILAENKDTIREYLTASKLARVR